LEQIKGGEYDPYDILTEYSGFLKNGRPNENKLSANVIRTLVKTARKFFRFNKINITLEDFNELVPCQEKSNQRKNQLARPTWLDISMLARISSSRQHSM
jgi:hypothetical protein